MRLWALGLVVFASIITLTACGSGGNSTSGSQLQQAQLTVSVAGSGTVTSIPTGINCPATCTTTFTPGTTVALTAKTASGFQFSGFSGACSGSSCKLVLSSNQLVSATFTSAPAQPSGQNITAINHIIVMLQENRSFDHYFGRLPDYWKAKGFPQATNGTTFDGEPSKASNADDTATTVNAYNVGSACTENPSPSWDEDHIDRNRYDPLNSTTAPLDGFVHTAGKDAVGFGFFDVLGHRVMGCFTGDQLNYYYFMASSFATSDRWFSPVMTRTQPNRMFLYAATSAGHAYPLPPNGPPLTNQTIFQLLQNHGVSWKIYVHPDGSGCATPSCLYAQSYLNQFSYGQYVINHTPNQFVPISQLLSDMQNGTLPQVAFVEPAGEVGLDEHPSDDDVTNPPNVQAGAAYVANIVNTLMTSTSWKDSVFILSFDEFGGFYDHVPPQPATPPGAIEYPTDLQTTSTGTDVCYGNTTDPVCGFFFTGFRVPLIVISPFTKRNYVSHTVADYTAILKLIETRFGLPNLTARDAAQPDMAEFFDFANVPWKTPPVAPAQATSLPCVLEALNAVTVSPNPAPAGGQATVTLSLSKAAIQPTTVDLTSSPPIPTLPSSAFIATGTSSTSFNITVPTGTTSLTITGRVGGIPVSTSIPAQ